MSNVGEAVVRIVGDSSSFDRTLSQLGNKTAGALNAKADRIGREFGERIGSGAGRALKIGVLSVVGGVAAAVGVTISKGFKRFTTIEDATAALTLQLGDATKAAGLLGEVLKVVEGTPFALQDFVDAARNLVAASVPLEKVPGILSAIGDAAAAAGGSAEDVNQVVDSIARLATGAEATLGPIRELESKGVPALRILANKAGISTTKMAKEITKGTVSSKKAIDDLVDGIINGTEGINGSTVAFGGAALAVGNTVSGAFSNMRTAISRAGAKIITVFADSGREGKAIVVILDSVRETIDVLGNVAVRVAKRMVGGDGFAGVLEFFEDLPKRVEDATASLGQSGGFSRTMANFFGFAGDFTADTWVAKIVDKLVEGFDKLPHEKISRTFTNVIIRAIMSIAENAAEITKAVVKAAPAIIRGVVEGLIMAAKEDPLNMALFIGALGVPGVGGAMAGLFSKMPFGFIVAPLITGLTTAVRTAFGITPLIPPSAVSGVGTAADVATGKVGKLAGAIRAIGGISVTATVGVLIGTEIERKFVKPAIDAFNGMEDHVDTQTFAMKTRFIEQLSEMGLGSQKLLPVSRVLNEISDEGYLSAEAMSDIYDNLTLLGSAVKHGINVSAAIRDIAEGGHISEDAVKKLRARIAELDRAKANPKIELKGGREAEGTIGRILKGLGDIVGRAWRAVVGVDESGGASGSWHKGGLVMHAGGIVPKLHAGTMNRVASGLGTRLRNDERLAVLQVGELVLSRGQVAQARQGVGLTQNFNVTVAGADPEVIARVMAYEAARAARR